MAFYTRAQWGAAAPRGTGNALGDPTGVTVHWEGPKIGSRPASQCAALVRSIQAFHQNGRGWSDIAYNLVVCEHGDVFEGRGASRGNAANGADALEIVERGEIKPDLLITDTVIPGIGGNELARRLTRALPQLKVLRMSGYADPEISKAESSEAPGAFVQKPFTLPELAQAVEQAMGG